MDKIKKLFDQNFHLIILRAERASVALLCHSLLSIKVAADLCPAQSPSFFIKKNVFSKLDVICTTRTGKNGPQNQKELCLSHYFQNPSH